MPRSQDLQRVRDIVETLRKGLKHPLADKLDRRISEELKILLNEAEIMLNLDQAKE